MDYLPSLLSRVDPAKPSLFELLAEQQLAGLIPPSLRYVLALLTHRYPRYLLRLLNNFDELYALLSVVVEKYYLETYGGGFVENFYGLKRERVLAVKGGEVRRAALGAAAEVREAVRIGGRRADVWRNLAVMVLLPYVKRKLDESYDVHVAPEAGLMDSAGLGGVEGRRFMDRNTLPPDATVKQRLMWAYKWFLRHVYPSVNAAYYFSVLVFSLGYLFDGTKYSSPFLWMVSTRIRRMGEADYRAIEVASKASEDALKAAMAAGGSRAGMGLAGLFHPRVLWPRLLGSLKLFLPTSIFALKFLEWWHASDFSRQLSRKAAEGLELPPPVVSGMGLVKRATQPTAEVGEAAEETTKSTSSSDPSSARVHRQANSSAKRDPPISNTTFLPIFTVPPPPSTDLCPICLHPIETPAACQTGHVFDFKCIFQWVEGTHSRQEAWMRGEKTSEWEDDDDDDDDDNDDVDGNIKDTAIGTATTTLQRQQEQRTKQTRREGRWESGKGRCAVTGRRVLGGTGGIRRLMV